MRRILNYFFTTLGVIFFVILIVLVHVYMTSSSTVAFSPSAVQAVLTQNENSAAVDEIPYLSEAQENMVKAVGVDPASLPTTLTEAQMACLLTAVGAARAQEIIGGETPTMSELFKAKACL